MIVALYAFIGMMAEDIIGVANTMAMARNRKNLAGITDMAAYLCVLETNHFALNALNGHNSVLTVVVIGAVTAANYLGSWTGVWIGERFIKSAPDPVVSLLIRKGLFSQSEYDDVVVEFNQSRHKRRKAA